LFKLANRCISAVIHFIIPFSTLKEMGEIASPNDDLCALLFRLIPVDMTGNEHDTGDENEGEDGAK